MINAFSTTSMGDGREASCFSSILATNKLIDIHIYTTAHARRMQEDSNFTALTLSVPRAGHCKKSLIKAEVP